MSAAHRHNNETNNSNLVAESVSGNLFNMLSTTVEWMLDTREMDENYHACKLEIGRLESMPSRELAKLGISKDQIPVYVFSKMFDNEQSNF